MQAALGASHAVRFPPAAGAQAGAGWRVRRISTGRQQLQRRRWRAAAAVAASAGSGRVSGGGSSGGMACLALSGPHRSFSVKVRVLPHW